MPQRYEEIWKKAKMLKYIWRYTHLFGVSAIVHAKEQRFFCNQIK
jgi:hypothetical protein